MATTFDALCAKGRGHQSVLTRCNNDIRSTVIKIQNAEDESYPTDRLRADLIDLRNNRKRSEIELHRHVAHCADGCKRRSGLDSAAHLSRVNDAVAAKPAMPGAGELAERICAGATVDQLAIDYERDPSTIRQRLNSGGFSTKTGEPREAKGPLQLLFARVDDQPWAEDALCAQTDPESFYPEKGGSTREAKAVCARCVVQAECLDYALDHEERFGIWGGLSERERRKIKPSKGGRRFEPIKHGTPGGATAHRRRGEQPCDDCRISENYAHNARRSTKDTNTQPLNTITQESA